MCKAGLFFIGNEQSRAMTRAFGVTQDISASRQWAPARGNSNERPFIRFQADILDWPFTSLARSLILLRSDFNRVAHRRRVQISTIRCMFDAYAGI